MFAIKISRFVLSRSFTCPLLNTYKQKCTIDYSKFPKLDEKELEEKFISGSGPGGSCVNKSTNCVLLKHMPTGLIIKCHESRLLQENQEIARKRLLTKLDEFYNGDMSVSAQKERISRQKETASDKKKEKLRQLKKQFLNSLESKS
ncbi:hypothetical protein JTE90_018305 [Oedothorax gibbosus]|uniref:Prokaryotic-type class I peptide chain release factors domain-containing protein n=1 Tax=Oedothorax gibbosus TaxID=931172 RepID=A0AAV6UDX7_9ARAC|nr:hypothetical protein JTE90_018305 [Oedothorax gibbosus]